MDDLLYEIQKEFDRIRQRYINLSDVIKNVNYISDDDRYSDAEKIRLIRDLTDKFIALKL